MVVADLFDLNQQSWNMQALVQFCGDQSAQQIVHEHRQLVLYASILDKLMYTWARNREFSINKAYQILIQLHPTI